MQTPSTLIRLVFREKLLIASGFSCNESEPPIT